MRNKKKLLIFFIVFFVLFFIVKKTSTIYPIIFNTFFTTGQSIKTTQDNTTNILLLGVGGGNHDGPELTDTIMLAHINPSAKKVSLLSIPRDLWVEDLQQKINTAYAKGNSKEKGGGMILAKAVTRKVVGRDIQYVVVVDFDGFVKAVDLVGGLDIVIDKSFDDYEYPVEEKREDLCSHSLDEATILLASISATEVFPCRYEHLHFDKGSIHLDGKTALKFVRSRYAVGEEGTDFARSKRQQKVINAFKDKAFSINTLLNPIRIANLYTVLSENIATDIPLSEFDDFIRLLNSMRPLSINSYLIEQDLDDPKSLLMHPPVEDFEGLWVLTPKLGRDNFTGIHDYIKSIAF